MPTSVILLLLGIVVQFGAVLLIQVSNLAYFPKAVRLMAAGEMDLFSCLYLAWAELWFITHLILPLWTIPKVWQRHPSAWAVCFAFLFCRTAGVTAFMVVQPFLLGRGGVNGILAAAAVAFGLLAMAFFRAHRWFGVPCRRGWMTLRRNGGWALALAAVVELGLVPLTVYALLMP